MIERGECVIERMHGGDASKGHKELLVHEFVGGREFCKYGHHVVARGQWRINVAVMVDDATTVGGGEGVGSLSTAHCGRIDHGPEIAGTAGWLTD